MKGQKIVIIFFISALLALCVDECKSSSIPMFEFLSRDEKLTTLYSMFAKQVSTYCKNKSNANTSQCKRGMMVYGMDKLNKMEESHLDSMDPFQKNSDSILWDSIMEGHDDMKKSHEDQRQLYLQKEQYHQQNPIFKDSPMSEEIENDYHLNYLQQGAETNNNYAYVSKPNDLDNQEHLEQNTNYLLGPMVSVMMPDGSPVLGQIPFNMPVDDDMHDMTMGQRKMPSIQDLLDSMTMDEKPKIIMELPPTTPQALKSSRTYYRNYNRQH